MSCQTELKYMQYVDGEMSPTDIAVVDAHLASCDTCAQLVTKLRSETTMLRAALPLELEAPEWKTVRPQTAVGALRNMAAAVGIGVAIQTLATTPPPAAGWIFPEGVTGLLVWQLLQAIPWVERVAAALIGLTVAILGARMLLHSRRAYSAGILAGAVLLSLPANAATVRTGQLVTVAAGETLDETLLAMAETVRIDGTLNGDLLAFARRIEIRGVVKGSVYTFAQALDARGPVEGAVWSFAQSVDVGARVGGNIYASGESVNLGPGATVIEMFAAGRTITLEGEVSRGVLSAGNRLILRGPVGRAVTFYGDEVEVSPPARIGGKLTAHVDDRQRVKITAPATAAALDVHERRSRFAEWSFYLGRVSSLAIALVLAWLGWRLAPDFLDRCVKQTARWWQSLLVGLAAAVLVPLVAVLLAITWIGLPLAGFAIGAYLTAMYVAKIVVGAYLGRALFPARHFLLQIAAGVALILIALELPLGIGTAVWLVVFVAGLGAFSWEACRRLSPGSPAA